MIEREFPSKAEAMLAETYETIRDPTGRIQRANNEIIQSLFSRNMIDWRTKNDLTTYTANPAKIYLLPKHHKSGMNSDQFRRMLMDQHVRGVRDS